MPEKFYYILCCIVWIWQQCVIKLLKYFELWINVLCFMDGGKFSDNYEYQEIKFLGPLNCPSCKKPSSAESKYSDWLWVWDLSPAISTSLLCVRGFSLNPGCPDLGGLVLYWWLPASKTNHGFWYCTFVCRELYHELCIHTSSYISIYCGITRTRALSSPPAQSYNQWLLLLSQRRTETQISRYLLSVNLKTLCSGYILFVFVSVSAVLWETMQGEMVQPVTLGRGSQYYRGTNQIVSQSSQTKTWCFHVFS